MGSAKDRDNARRAWDQVIVGITGAKDELDDFREKFVTTVDNASPLADLEAELEEKLGVPHWEWPWFEEWSKKFADAGIKPSQWPNLVPEPDLENPYTDEELAIYRRSGIAPLIARTAAMIFYRDRHLSKAHSFVKFRLEHGGDPAQKLAAADHEEAFKAENYNNMPPYFPGDRTILLPDSPIGAELSVAAAGAIVPEGADMPPAGAPAAAVEAAPPAEGPKAGAPKSKPKAKKAAEPKPKSEAKPKAESKGKPRAKDPK